MKKIKINWNTALVAVILCELIIFGAKKSKIFKYFINGAKP
jgi:hypothetical protein